MAGIALIPSLSSCSKPVVSNDITLGYTGLGRQAMYLLNGFINIEGVKVVAGCDVYGRKRTRFENRVNEFYSQAKKDVEIDTYEKYSELGHPVKWNPVTQSFADDPEGIAASLLHYKYREPYSL
jgi:hypothetical protein